MFHSTGKKSTPGVYATDLKMSYTFLISLDKNNDQPIKNKKLQILDSFKLIYELKENLGFCLNINPLESSFFGSCDPQQFTKYGLSILQGVQTDEGLVLAAGEALGYGDGPQMWFIHADSGRVFYFKEFKAKEDIESLNFSLVDVNENDISDSVAKLLQQFIELHNTRIETANLNKLEVISQQKKLETIAESFYKAQCFQLRIQLQKKNVVDIKFDPDTLKKNNLDFQFLQPIEIYFQDAIFLGVDDKNNIYWLNEDNQCCHKHLTERCLHLSKIENRLIDKRFEKIAEGLKKECSQELNLQVQDPKLNKPIISSLLTWMNVNKQTASKENTFSFRK